MAMKANKEQETGEVLSRGEHFFEKHANLIFYIVLGLIIIAFGVWAYIQYVAKPRTESAYEALYSAEDNFIMGEDSTVLSTTGISDQGVMSVAKDYKSTKAATLAHLYAGVANYDLGKYQEALQELKKYSAKDQLVSPSILRLMGDCCVQLDRFEEAIDYFKKAADKADNPVVSPGCLIKAARVYEHMQKTDKALGLYKEVKDKYYDSPEATSVLADITRIEGSTK